MLIPYSELFVNTGAYENTRYFKMPPGYLRVIDGKAVFCRDVEVPVEARKKIVLCGEYLKVLEAAEISAILDKLLESKFEIFIYVAGRLTAINQENMFMLESLINLERMDDKKNIITTAERNGIPKDQLYFLNETKIIQILQEATEPCIDENFYNAASGNTNNVEGLFADNNIVFCGQISDELQSALQVLYRIIDKEEIPYFQPAWLIGGDETDLLSVNVTDHELTAEDKELQFTVGEKIRNNIRQISVVQCSAEMHNIIDFYSGITSLNMFRWTGYEIALADCMRHINWNKLKNLDSLEISGYQVSVEDINYILEECPNIKNLKISDCQIINYSETNPPLIKNNLRAFTYVGNQMLRQDVQEWADDFVDSILIGAPNLVFLRLEDEALQLRQNDNFPECAYGVYKCQNSHYAVSGKSKYMQDFTNFLVLANKTDDYVVNQYFYDEVVDAYDIGGENVFTLSFGMLQDIDVDSLSYIFSNSPNLSNIKINRNVDTFLNYFIDKMRFVPIEDRAKIRNLHIENVVTATQLYMLLDLFPSLSTLNFSMLKHDDDLIHFIKQKSIKYSLRPNRQSSNGNFSAALTNPNEAMSFNVVKKFFANSEELDPHVAYYRDDVFQADMNPLRAVMDANSALNLSAYEPTVELLHYSIDKCEISVDNHDFRRMLQNEQLFGTTELVLSSEWVKLPSISCDEVLQQLLVHKLGHPEHEVDIEVGYSGYENRYYIRSKQPLRSSVVVNMVFNVSKPVEHLQQFDSVPELESAAYKNILDTCAGFSAKKTDISFPLSLDDLYTKLYNNQSGSCRERHIIFAYKLIEAGWPVENIRLVSSGIHIFCEVFSEGNWHGLDLGGTLAALQVTNPITQNKAPLAMQAATETKQKLKNLSEISLNNWPSKTLLHINEDATVNYAMGLLKTYTTTGAEVFYVHLGAELSCQDKHSALYKFLTNNKKNRILIINWNNFSSEEIAQANSILDEVATLDGVDIPKSVKIVGLQDPHVATAYVEEDFYSRHDAVMAADPKIKPQSIVIPWIEPSSMLTSSEVVIIDCFAQPNWQDFVFGTWQIDANGPHFNPSQLLQKMQQGESISKIIIKNPPVANEGLQLFFSQAFIRGYFEYVGVEYDFKNIQVQYTDHFDWKHSQDIINWSESAVNDAFILNNSTVHQLFQQYSFEKDGSLKILHGLISESKQQGKNILNLQLSHNIKTSYWARILDACQKYNIQLNIVPCPDVAVPLGFKKPNIYQPSLSNSNFLSSRPYLAANILADSLIKEQKHAVSILDVSELQPDELVANIEYTNDDGQLRYDFKISDIISKLEAGETVIFYGSLSPSMAEYFASMLTPEPHLWINGVRQTFAGKLIFVVDEKNAANFKFANLQYFSGDMADNAGKSMRPVIFSKNTSTNRSEDINQDRLELLLQVIKHNPIAYISGATGIGKSSFVNNVLQDTLGLSVYHDLDALDSWINDTGTDDCVLFIDEANMLGSGLTLFSGLFRDPRQMFYKGKMYTLSERHKIILAGNPVTYAGERKLPLLLQQHPEIEVKFDPLSIKYIYENILSDLNPNIANTITSLYKWSLTLNADEVLITARELKMIKALISAGYSPRYAITTIFLQAIPTDRHAAFLKCLTAAWSTYNPKDVTNYDYATMSKLQLAKKYRATNEFFKVQDYVITESRKDALLNICSLLDVRKNSLKHNQPIPMAGLVLEGQPGDGKSELIRVVLENEGYKRLTMEQLFDVSLPPAGEHYVLIGGKLGIKQKREMLLQAYKKGIPVVMDEFSSNVGLERTLNDILMHQYKGVKAASPGFVLFGTQNPISFSGRKKLSNALQRRLIHLELPSYSKEEMLQVLHSKYPKLDISRLEKLVNSHISKPFTKIGMIQIKQTFRDLLTKAKIQNEAVRTTTRRRPSI